MHKIYSDVNNKTNSKHYGAVVLFLSAFLVSTPIFAQNYATPTIAQSMLTGGPGLYETPNARFAPSGQLRFGLGYEETYRHTSIGAQITPWAHINLRQSTSVLDGDRYKGQQFRGVDVKLRLREESEHLPAVAIGANSLIGRRRLQSEYITLSKKWGDFDTHLGLGWGRLAGRNTVSNPMRRLSGTFDDKRDFNNITRIETSLSDYLTGDHAGLFAGVSYQTQYEPLKVFLEASSKDNQPEDAFSTQDLDQGSTFNLGFNYQLNDHLQLTGAWQNLNYFGVHLSAPLGLSDLNLPTQYKDTSHLPAPRKIINKDDISHVWLEIDEEHESVPYFMRRSFKATEEDTTIDHGRSVKFITQKHGLKGYEIIMVSRDLEEKNRYLTTPPELWRNSEYEPNTTYYKTDQLNDTDTDNLFKKALSNLTINLKHEHSIQDFDSAGLHRSRAIVDYFDHRGERYFSGLSIGANLNDNFDRATGGAIIFTPTSVRSDVTQYNDNTINLERFFFGANYNIAPQIYANVTMGDFEEMFSAAGGQILYRPLGKRIAVQGSFWYARKRNPDNPFDSFFTTLTTNGGAFYDDTYTGHLDLFYEVPEHDMTYKASIGRCLAEDWGLRLGLTKRFKNNIELSMGATASYNSEITTINRALRNLRFIDSDVYLVFDMRLRVPLHHKLGLPVKTFAELDFSPIALDEGERLDVPYDLYEETEGLSIRHLTSHWSDIK